MANSQRHPIIANGEAYIESLIRKPRPNSHKFPHEYYEAKSRLWNDIDRIQQFIASSEEVFVEDKILCVRLEEKYEAKSYTPSSIVADTSMRLVGGRKYVIDPDTKGKLYFVRAKDGDLAKFKNTLSSTRKDGNQSWKDQICTIRTIDLLQPKEKALGFDEQWTEGDVEVVIHPLGINYQDAINGFFNTTGISPSDAAVRTYDDGLTFVCTKMNAETLTKAMYYNPLRSIKPIEDEWDDPFRMSPITDVAPQLPDVIIKPDLKIGVFDGGVPNDIPLLAPYVTNYDMVDDPPTEKGLEHGCAVSGAILYGDLYGKTRYDKVENPRVSVESFRVRPAKRTGDAEKDFQMYTTIDIIEKVVRERKDIKVFNISMGPRGAIIDDEISRFTYVCDLLSYDVDEGEINPLFVTAAGNDGNLEEPLNRIQAPADMVNGIAVGSYSYTPLGERTVASYSCVGPGREGGKIKPDLLEFGGSMNRLFIAVMNQGNLTGAEQGTSFSAPVVAGKIGKLMAASEKIIPHLARTILIHHAESETLEGTNEEGFGYCPDDVEALLECDDNSVTILYSGEIMAGSSVKLPIYMPEVNKHKGTAKIKWTISTVVNPNMKDSDAYTNNCIEDTFYPHEMTFNFSKYGSATKKINLMDQSKYEEVQRLMDDGYSKSDLPASKPAKKSFREADLRNSDFKWDTIIRKFVSMRTSSLLNPFISLHAIGRDEGLHEKVRYNVVITIDVPKYDGSLYDSILQKYRNLSPIKVQNVNRLQATNK